MNFSKSLIFGASMLAMANCYAGGSNDNNDPDSNMHVTARAGHGTQQEVNPDVFFSRLPMDVWNLIILHLPTKYGLNFISSTKCSFDEYFRGENPRISSLRLTFPEFCELDIHRMLKNTAPEQIAGTLTGITNIVASARFCDEFKLGILGPIFRARLDEKEEQFKAEVWNGLSSPVAQRLFRMTHLQQYDVDMSIQDSLQNLPPYASNLEIKNFDPLHIQKLNGPIILNLRECSIDDNGLDACLALLNDENLLKLEFYGTNIGDKGFGALAAALQKNRTLRELSLSFNNISSEVVKSLAAALQGNKTLRKFGLSNNKIDIKGARELKQALVDNKELWELNLYEDNLDDEGAKIIAKALKVNTTLGKLVLSCNDITDEGATYLLDILKQRACPPHMLLAIKDNSITSEVREQFKQWASEVGAELDI